MILSRLILQNFRNYTSADFTFKDGVTFIVGPNTAGKSNIIEAIYLLSYGKSFRTEKDEQMLAFGHQVARVKGKKVGEEESILEVVLAEGSLSGKTNFMKKYLVNDLPKRRADFAGHLQILLFDPTDLDIVTGSPSLRREFLDEVLEQTDRDYRQALITYTKALRQRNALLHHARETGIRQEKQFAYWDELLIRTGTIITTKREAFIVYLNEKNKALFICSASYDHSIISEERLAQYKEAELGAGVTLVGPHRDEVKMFMGNEAREDRELKSFGSRGQQRLAIVQLKLLQLQYLQEYLQEKPILLLDDIFSELDEGHIKHILEVVGEQQTIITTTHKEFIEQAGIRDAEVIEISDTNNTKESMRMMRIESKKKE